MAASPVPQLAYIDGDAECDATKGTGSEQDEDDDATIESSRKNDE